MAPPPIARRARRRERAARRGTRASRARVAMSTAAAFVLSSSTLMTWMPTFCSAFVVPAPAATGSFCGCGGAGGQAVERSSLRRPLPQRTLGASGDRRDGAGGINMLWSGGKRTQGNEVTVNIERTSMNSRRISGSIVINRPIEDVWLTLTDYDRLAEYVPNLTQSKVKPSDEGQIRLWQEGAQKIVGFDFRASVEMLMDEHFGDPENRMAQRKLTFGLLDSRMFNEFDGEWRMQFNSRKQVVGPSGPDFQYSTKLFYMVHIRPKGPVPVMALEWQISNEVPNNLAALKKAAEAVTPDYVEMRHREREEEIARRNSPRGLAVPAAAGAAQNGAADRNDIGRDDVEAVAKVGAEAFVARGNGSDGYAQPEWETDETLEAYIAKG